MASPLVQNKVFKVLDKEVYFDNALEAQVYAKGNPGTVIVRSDDADNSSHTYKKVEKEKKLEKTPAMIVEYLNQHVIAQDEAKRELALSMYYHSLTKTYRTAVPGSKPMMLIGPTGSGKTFLVQKVCEYMKIMFIHVDVSTMVPEGIKGYTITHLIEDILKRSVYNLYTAEKCVIFLDEVDKLFTNDEDGSDFGSEVAHQLLRFIEGQTFKLSNEDREKVMLAGPITSTMRTNNMFFILGGAFQWIMDHKNQQGASIGFTQEDSTKNATITLEDLYDNNIPKELLGRMGSIVNLKKLNEDDYFKILTSSESSPLNDFIKQIKFHGDQVEITQDTLHEVAKAAARSELGVRSLHQILKKMFQEALFATAEGMYRKHTITYRDASKGI